MQTDNKPEKRAFDAIIIVPLEEEFEIVLEQFTVIENLTDDKHIRFAVAIPNHRETYLIVKQALMGRAESAEATHSCLSDFDTGILVCVGIAGGLSNDVAIGDVCYTGTIIDILDNQKITELPSGQQQTTLSPTHYHTPRELATPIALHRINPETKPTYLEWTVQRHQNALTLIPNEFTGRAGKKETIRKPVVHEGAIVCGPVSGSPEYNEKLKGIDRKVLAIETESGGMFGVAYNRRVPAISIRGISDYAGAGIDKNKFDEETNRNARAVAALNAATFLTHQLRSAAVRAYLDRCRSVRSNGTVQPSFFPILPADRLADALRKH